MRGLRWLLTGLVVLLVCLLAGVWLLPSVLDWNRYRGAIAELASERIGLPVRIDGPITLSLLPQPTLTAGKVSLGQAVGGQAVGGQAVGGGAPGGVAVTAAELRLRVALGPLLAGRVDAQDLVLRGPDITLPWHPGPGGLGPGVLAVPAPDWLASLSARIAHGRLRIGRFVMSDINATLATSDATGSYAAAGTAQLGGHAWHFTARLTRPGGDGAVGIDLSLDGQGKAVGLGATLSGQIARDGTLTGRIAGRGPDLSQVMPAPAVPFRASGRVNVAGGLAVADQLTGEIGGSPSSGAVALRLEPRPRLDVAVTASRLDLDAWAPALLRAASAGVLHDLPVGIDLSAEAAQLDGGTLRRLRGAFDLADGTVVVREARALLPGDAQLRLTGRILPPAGAGAGARFDGKGTLWAPSLRTTLAWTGAPAAGRTESKIALADQLPPLALRTLRLSGHVVADATQVLVDDMRGTLDGGAMAGAITLGLAGPPEMRVRVSLDRLDLDPWLPGALPSPAALSGRLGGMALDLSLTAHQALLRGVPMAPFSLELGLGANRIALRKAAFTVDGVEGTLSGTLLEGGRLADGRLDLQSANAGPLAALLPDWLPGWFTGTSGTAQRLAGLLKAPIWRNPAALQVQAAGTAEALSLRVAGKLGDLRLEAQPTLDLSHPGWRWSGPVTLRHPGAPRLAVSLGLTDAPDWLGDGSFSLVAQVTASPEHLALGNFALTAGGLRASGVLDLRGDAAGGPMLTGQVTADQLPLPLVDPQATDPLPLGLLAGWQGHVRLDATRVLAGAVPLLDKASATLALSDGTLRLEGLTAQLAGGALALEASLDSRAGPPVLALRGTLTGAAIPGPLLDQPFDLTAGTLDGTVNLAAAGSAPAALVASLSGTLGLTVRDGALAGVDLPGLAASLTAEAKAATARPAGAKAAGAPPPSSPATSPPATAPPATPPPATASPASASPGVASSGTASGAGPADAGVRKALGGGSMGFDRLDLTGTVAHGVVQFDHGRLSAPSGSMAIAGSLSLPDSMANLRLELHPQLPAADSGAVVPPTLGLRIDGTLAAPRRAPELSDLIRWRADLRR